MSQIKQESVTGENDDILSIAGVSEWTLDTSNSSYINENAGPNESSSKITLLEEKNKTLEGKLDNLELRAQNRAMMEESELTILKEENKAILEQLKETETRAKMEKNALETTIKALQQNIAQSVNKMVNLKVEQQRQKMELENVKKLRGSADKISETRLFPPWVKWVGIFISVFIVFIIFAICFETKPDVLWNSLIQGVRLGNPPGNAWNKSNTKATISGDGLQANSSVEREYEFVYAEKGFGIHWKYSRKVNFPGTILYYFEITQMSFAADGVIEIGLSEGHMPENTYAFSPDSNYFLISGHKHSIEWPSGAIKPTWKGRGYVYGCGLLLSSDNEFAIFFTGNGRLIGKQIPINPMGEDRLIPTISIYNACVHANFGNDLVYKPFYYNIYKCPGLIFE